MNQSTVCIILVVALLIYMTNATENPPSRNNVGAFRTMIANTTTVCGRPPNCYGYAECDFGWVATGGG